MVARIRCVLTTRIDFSLTDEVRRRFEMLVLFAVQIGENLKEKRRLKNFIVSKCSSFALDVFFELDPSQ